MEPIALIYTDFHLKPSNIKEVSSLCEEAISIATKNKVTTHIWLGDIFDNRVSQRQDVLNALTSIIEMYDKANHKIICLVGNHDKSDYSKEDSFLDPYKYHPSFDLISDYDYRSIQGVPCFFLPFFADDLLSLYMDVAKNDEADIFFGHFAVTGSRNNDGSTVDNKIKPSLFKGYKAVYLGHYHDYQEIGKNIYHLGSLQQNNFGEDEKKGFWLLKDDCSVEWIKGTKGIVYKKEIVDLDQVPPKQVKSVLEKLRKDNEGTKLRIELWGTEDKLEAFDKSDFTNLGIDFKKKHREIEVVSKGRSEEARRLTDSDILEKFKSFCKENGYDYPTGLTILKEVLCR